MDVAKLAGRMKDCLFLIPQEKFDALTSDKGYVDSFLYLLACIVISAAIFFALATFAPSAMYGSQEQLAAANYAPPSPLQATPMRVIFALPIAYITFGFLHLALKLLGATGDFHKSVQMLIYGNTGSTLFSAIPYVNFIFMLIALVNCVSGAVRVHKMQLWKAIVALFVVPLAAVFVVSVLATAYVISSGPSIAAVE